MDTDDVLALVGRLFVAIIFLASAFGKITNFDGTMQFMELGAQHATEGRAVTERAVILQGEYR